METICIKCQILFSGKNKKKINILFFCMNCQIQFSGKKNKKNIIWRQFVILFLDKNPKNITNLLSASRVSPASGTFHLVGDYGLLAMPCLL